MKTKITLFIGLVALVTLSFTFATVEHPKNDASADLTSGKVYDQVGGLISDEVVK